MRNTYCFLLEGKFPGLITQYLLNTLTEEPWMQLKQLGSALDFNHFFSPLRISPSLYTCLWRRPVLHILTAPSGCSFPEMTALKQQTLPLFQITYDSEAVALKVTSQNLFYWSALKPGSPKPPGWANASQTIASSSWGLRLLYETARV